MPRKNTLIKTGLYKTTLFLLGLGIGTLIPWYFYIQYVTQTLINERWDVPSVVYARSLQLYEGLSLSPQALTYELDLLGYRAVNHNPQPGEYRHQAGTFDIHSKGFVFVDKPTRPNLIKLRITGQSINSISPKLARLEPAVIGRFFNSDFERRRPIELAQIPPTMIAGLQAVEDRNFKHHHGVSWWGVIRAALKNLMAGKVVQGGSTITQQLIKNKLRYNENSLLRKLHEAMAATILESKLDKGQILALYFNEIYWGQDGKVAVHGLIEAASHYFAKPVNQLNLAEQALLIGIIKGPSWYNPYKQASRAIKRRNLVLKQWFETGVITESEWRWAQAQSLNLSSARKIRTDHDDYMDVVKEQLLQQFSTRDLNQKGLQIHTHLDPFIQHKTVQTARRTDQWLAHGVESAILVSHPKTGILLSVAGSKSAQSQYNRALWAKRQIGSLIKPLLYLSGLHLLGNFDLNERLKDQPLTIRTDDGTTWQPNNWDNDSWGSVSAKQALVHSRNQATVDLGQRIGLTNFIRFLNQMGLQVHRNRHPALFLGAIELTPFEVQNIYTQLSSSGRSSQVNSIDYITDANNRLVNRSHQKFNSVLNRNHLDIINQALHEVTVTGTAKKIKSQYNLTDQFHGKTGTTNKGRDSWFVGYSDSLLATVWVGRDDNKSTPYSGSSGALVLWSHLMLNL